jgi:hypothetical protein
MNKAAFHLHFNDIV